ncbi:MAPEG family protein [Vibrio gangliei]|nr:MAPEG family protein [Vibrio gangliei]
MLAMVHTGSRVIYNILYLLNIGLLRTLSWAIAMGCSFAIMWQCIPF